MKGFLHLGRRERTPQYMSTLYIYAMKANNQTIAPIHQVIICGSYERSRFNERLCNLLGNKLAERNLGLISGGGKPGIKVAESMNRTLSDLGQYDPFKIINVFRKKKEGDLLETKRIGCNLFVGSDVHDIREYLFTRSRIMIAISGALKTKEEVVLA